MLHCNAGLLSALIHIGEFCVRRVRQFVSILFLFLLLFVFSNVAQQLKGQRLVAECPPAAASLTNLKQPTEVICNKSNL